MSAASTDNFAGSSWKIPEPFHSGHTLTVGEGDENGYWIECSCGAKYFMGSAHIARAVAEKWTPYGVEDARSRPKPVKASKVRR